MPVNALLKLHLVDSSSAWTAYRCINCKSIKRVYNSQPFYAMLRWYITTNLVFATQLLKQFEPLESLCSLA